MKLLQHSTLCAGGLVTPAAALICVSVPNGVPVVILVLLAGWLPYVAIRTGRTLLAPNRLAAGYAALFATLYLAAGLATLFWILQAGINVPARAINTMANIWISTVVWQIGRALVSHLHLRQDTVAQQILSAAVSVASVASGFALMVRVFGASWADALIAAAGIFALLFFFVAMAIFFGFKPAAGAGIPNFVSDMRYKYLPGNIFNPNRN